MKGGAKAQPAILRKQEGIVRSCAVVRVPEPAAVQGGRQRKGRAGQHPIHTDTQVGQRSGRGAEAQADAASTQQDTEEARASGTRDCTMPGESRAEGRRQRRVTPERRPLKDATLTGGNGEGDHLFPYRTQKLSPSAPMVLGWKRPGRVGRRRFPIEAVAKLQPLSQRKNRAGSCKNGDTGSVFW